MFYTFGTLHWAAKACPPAGPARCGRSASSREIASVRLFGPASCGASGAARTDRRLAAAAAVVRWLAMGFDPPLALLLPLQVLHGLTFGATHVGAIHFMGRAVPRSQTGTAQALYASVTGGIAMGGAMLIAGPLYATYGR